MSDLQWSDPQHQPRSRTRRVLARRPLATAVTAVAALSGLVAAGVLVPATAGAGVAAGTVAPAAHDVATGKHRDAVQKGLDSLVRDDKYPGVLANVRTSDGWTRNYTAGVGDLRTGAKVPVNGRVRIASNTKTFTATVVLQLVGEGKVSLDAPIEKYLPKLIRGNGIDGRAITVRQVLQQTSGLPEYTDDVAGNFPAGQHVYLEPRELLDTALKDKASFRPGARFEYSNTNYVVAGLLIQKVTGRPVGEQIKHRIIDRIGLRDTYWPGIGEQTIRGRHPRGYFAAKPGAPLVDVTELDPAMGWAAGQLVSTPSDLNKFFVALLGGKLLKPAQLQQMKTTVDAPEFDAAGKHRYGLGIARSELSCGRVAWGHGGDIFGYESRVGVTTDGRAVAIVTTALPTSIQPLQHLLKLVDDSLCR